MYDCLPLLHYFVLLASEAKISLPILLFLVIIYVNPIIGKKNHHSYNGMHFDAEISVLNFQVSLTQILYICPLNYPPIIHSRTGHLLALKKKKEFCKVSSQFFTYLVFISPQSPSGQGTSDY